MPAVLQTQARLTTGNGPLPTPERHFIALMVRTALVLGIALGFWWYWYRPHCMLILSHLLPQGSSITGCESLERLQVRIPHLTKSIHPSPSYLSPITGHLNHCQQTPPSPISPPSITIHHPAELPSPNRSRHSFVPAVTRLGWQDR